MTTDLAASTPPLGDGYAHECHVRDLYARRLTEFRPEEMLLKTEHSYAGSRVRADMRTVSSDGVIRVWEFKILAGYEGLGQALTYLALARKEQEFGRPIRAVLAAFAFQPEIRTTIEVLNLGIELVELPAKLRLAGGVPDIETAMSVPTIPHLTDLLPPTFKES
ncbi:hypothetical protein MED01_003110 [Micromonospora sp. MED01]|uniref:hypothetical protein n=1 Tax=Micromonospora alfalfae TaxID=2911212 RepID=UPI001EE87CDB|nr:hypothetical protein [Micromonospora alfalfae]MCG5464851.1 hypothetical protein [Micromonospora alfalfae]